MILTIKYTKSSKRSTTDTNFILGNTHTFLLTPIEKRLQDTLYDSILDLVLHTEYTQNTHKDNNILESNYNGIIVVQRPISRLDVIGGSFELIDVEGA